MKTPIANSEIPNPIAEGTNMQFRHAIAVNAPPDRIWALWMDVDNWSTWDPLIKESSSTEPLKLGVEGEVIPVKGLPSKFKIVSFEPCVKWALEASLIAAKLKITRSLVAQGGLTTFTHEVEFTGFASSIFANLLGPGFRAALPGVMCKLAAHAIAAEND
jgi:ligand-binding SRPBCC domain-containing protein